ncbi:glycerophosphoryl diester phosphodiesterase [Cribrihabitans marinus]|uniref:Glycerophosphoryl diester phosphodiesterase n=1 Tax=Cribrihabitans marinus TaxID=1227549 RepID=A0A1H7CCV8_9RHOB|nr:glycerophosphodiester phosphodiesterase [Cribrihabitans marinus]GGH35155.1 hypothetical protein GCM10010973_28290 [Cribrihabitans marinus]SEJ87539.1 glycerophosphoryl diester phosphodiesterase [Cribrihabitans marinus]
MSNLTEVVSAYKAAWARKGLFVPLYAVLRMLSLALIAPAFAALVNLAVSLSNQSALTDQDIAMFVLSPVGAPIAIAVCGLFLVAEVLGFSVMAASVHTQAGSVWAAGAAGLSLVLRRGPALFSFALRFVLRVLLISLPFLLLSGAVAWWTLTEYDINYYLTFRPPAFRVAVLLIGALLLVLAWILIRRLSSWALALHLVLFEQRPPANAFEESAERMQGQTAALRRRLALWLALRLAIGAGLAALAGAAIGLVPTDGADGLRTELRLTLLVVGLWGLAGLILSATALGALAVIIDGFLDTPRLEAPARGRASIRRRLAVAVALSAAVLLGASWFAHRATERFASDGEVVVIGHRGAAGARPENTMASILQAIEDKADWVEIDVQESADGEIVVMHDSDYMKLAGVDLKVWNGTLEELRQIDIGSWFDPAYSDQRTPTLREVLEAARGTSSRVLIELKYYGHDVDLERRVIALVDAAGMTDRVATMSLKYPAVQKMHNLRPDWQAGVLAATAVGDLSRLEADFVAVNTGLARAGLIRKVQATGKDFFVWTVNDPLQMNRMISMGVDGLITDEPVLARQVIAARADLSAAERALLMLAGAVDLTRQTEALDDRP